MSQVDDQFAEVRPTVPKLTGLKAIRHKCLDCSAGSPKEAKLCSVTSCPLWPFRFGRRPASVVKRSPELLDAKYVRIAGIVSGEREIGSKTRWTDNPRISAAIRAIFGTERPNPQVVSRILGVDVLGRAEVLDEQEAAS